MKYEDFPEIIKEVGFDFAWENEKVWALAVPVTEMDIEELTWHFDIPFLWYGGEIYNLTCKQVFDDPQKYKYEHDRMQKADVGYPIDVMENKGKWLILDGLHRLMKLHQDGMKRVRVRIIPREKIPEILKDN